jgi:hypothetical protein
MDKYSVNTNSDSVPETLTIADLARTVQEIQNKYPAMGLKEVQSRFLPDGMRVFTRPGQMVIVEQEKEKIVVITDPMLR